MRLPTAGPNPLAEFRLTEPLATLRHALGDRYQFERELGRGGMATVYLVQDVKHDRPVALKVLHPELAATLGPDRFLREVKLAARLQHPHVLSVHDSGEIVASRESRVAGEELATRDSRPATILWFTMPYVDGESLRDRLGREKQLPLDDALRITREAAQGLRYAHEHGVIHRDIKPENLLLTEDGNTLVADFGVARAMAGAPAGGHQEITRLTETGFAVGTPAYMSPEQATGTADIDARSDVYGLGCVLYEMLAGEPPFTGATPQALIAKRFAGPAPKVNVLRPGVPPQVVGAIDRALAASPADRFATMGDFARALELASPAAATAPEAPPARSRRRTAVRVVAAAAIVAAAYGGLRWAGVLPGDSLVAAGVLAPRDQLVLTEFVNHANDSSLATAVTEAFRVDFAESGLVGLASPDRIRRALRLMQRPDTARLTPDLGREVALRQGLKAVLSGEVSRLGDGYMISAQVIGADSGAVLAAHRETAASAAGIIPAVDRLSRELRRRVGESLRHVRAAPPLDAVTTGSLDALRKYALGARLTNAGRYEESLPFFEQAVQLDSTFAMAWRAIGVDLWNMGSDPARMVESMSRAYALRDHLTERERFGTEAQYFEWVRADRTRARAAWQALLAIDPNNAAALTDLGLLTWFEGDFAKASDLAARSIRADSNSVAPYTNLVDAQVTLGRFADAETTLARGLAHFGPSVGHELGVGTMASARQDYDSASRAFRRAFEAGEGGQKAAAAIALGGVAAVRGKLDEARRYHRIGAELAPGEDPDLFAFVLDARTGVYPNLSRDARVKRLDSVLASPAFQRIDPTRRHYGELALLYANAGRPDRATAVAEEERKVLEAAGPAGRRLLDGFDHRMLHEGLEGMLLVDRGRFDEAVGHFRQAGRIYSGPGWLPEIGSALDRAGATDSALAVYERYLTSTWNYRLMFDASDLAPVLHRVGELYELRGDRARAVEAYERFVSLWRDADPVLQPQVTEVKRRLAELTAEPR